MIADVFQAVVEMPRKVKIIIIPPVNEFGRRIGEVKHAPANVAKGARGRGLVNNSNARMSEMERHRMLIVNQ